MTKDHVVSVRLTEDERRFLSGLGRPSDVVRGWLRAARTYALAPSAGAKLDAPWLRRHAWVTPGISAVWQDGTTGQTWPPVATR